MVWNTSVGAELASVRGHSGSITGLTWLERMPQRTLASVGRDSAVKIWFEKRNATGVLMDNVWKNDWLKSMPLCVASDAASKRLFIGQSNGKVSVWDASAPQLDVVMSKEVQCHSGKVTALDLSPDGALVLTGGSDSQIKLHNREEEEWKALSLNLRKAKHAEPVTAVQFAASGREFVSASKDGTAIAWSLGTKEPKFTLVGHDSPVLCATFVGDGMIMTGAEDHTIMLWDASGVDEMHVQENLPRSIPSALPAVPRVSRSLPAFNTVAKPKAPEDARPVPKTPADLRHYSQDFEHCGPAVCSAATPSGVYAATGGAGGEVKVYWIRTYREDRVLLGHRAPIRSLCFSSDDKLLASADEHGTVMLWVLPQFEHLVTLYAGRDVAVTAMEFVALDEASVELPYFHVEHADIAGMEVKDHAEEVAAALKLQSIARGQAARRESKRNKASMRRKGNKDDYLEDTRGKHWLLATGLDNGWVSMWDSKTGKQWGLSPTERHRGSVVALRFVRDSQVRYPKLRQLPIGYDDVVDDDDDDDDDDDGDDEVGMSRVEDDATPSATMADFTCARLVSVASDGSCMTWRMGTLEPLCTDIVGLCGTWLVVTCGARAGMGRALKGITVTMYGTVSFSAQMTSRTLPSHRTPRRS